MHAGAHVKTLGDRSRMEGRTPARPLPAITAASPAVLMAASLIAAAARSSRAAACAAVRNVVLAWRKMSPPGRIAVGLLLFWPVCAAAEENGILPDKGGMGLLAAAAAVAAYGGAIKLGRLRGQRQWRQGTRPVMHGHGVELGGGVVLTGATVTEYRARTDELERRVEALSSALSTMCLAAGMAPPVDLAQPGPPVLRLVGDSERPMRSSSLQGRRCAAGPSGLAAPGSRRSRLAVLRQ
jgi:hypothetical protein